MDLKSLAKVCIEAEEYFKKHELTIEPRVLMDMLGCIDKEKVPVLTAINPFGQEITENLSGQFVTYSEQRNATSIYVLCSDIRRLFGGLGIHPEELLGVIQTSMEKH